MAGVGGWAARLGQCREARRESSRVEPILFGRCRGTGNTSAKGPRAGFGGRGAPTRAISVPMVVSVTKGTVPVTAS